MNLTLFNNQINGNNNTKLALSNQKLLAVIEQKQTMLLEPKVLAKLSPIELSIAQAGTKTPLRLTEERELEKSVLVSARFICRDVGIRHWDDKEKMKYESIRFFSVLKSYYSELTVDEINSAFEMASTGMLDEYLPKDKNGDPDKNHYQQFSVEYYTKILNAFRKKKGDIWGKVRLALPAPEMVIPESVRKRNYQELINDIYNAYIAYQKGVSPRFEISIYIKELIERGHLKELPTPVLEDYEKAYRAMLVSSLPSEEKKKLKAEYALPGMPEYFKNEAQRTANNRAIAQVFDVWIKNNFDLIEKNKNDGSNIS